LIVEGEYARAERLLRDRLDRSSRAGHAFYALGVLLVARGRFAEARVIIERAIRVRPWTRDFPTDQLDLLPRLGEMAAEHGDWAWLHFQRQRHRFASVGLSINNAVHELLADEDVVVQIGANDGRRADPIHKLIRSKPALRGVLVEPMPEAFESLVRNSQDIASRFACENAAVGAENGTAKIFYDPTRRTTLSSFRPEQTMLGEQKDTLQSIDVPMLTLEALFKKHGIERLGLFQTDTEGFDWIILRQLDLKRMRPAIVNCEHYSLTWNERIEMCEHLYDHGYAWRFGVMDMIAIDRQRFGDNFAFYERW
jgi:FkbM family methyltransferase